MPPSLCNPTEPTGASIERIKDILKFVNWISQPKIFRIIHDIIVLNTSRINPTIAENIMSLKKSFLVNNG